MCDSIHLKWCLPPSVKVREWGNNNNSGCNEWGQMQVTSWGGLYESTKDIYLGVLHVWAKAQSLIEFCTMILKARNAALLMSREKYVRKSQSHTC